MGLWDSLFGSNDKSNEWEQLLKGDPHAIQPPIAAPESMPAPSGLVPPSDPSEGMPGVVTPGMVDISQLTKPSTSLDMAPAVSTVGPATPVPAPVYPPTDQDDSDNESDAAPAKTASAPSKFNIQDFLKTIYSGGGDIQQAQDQARKNQLVATLAQAAGQVGHGLSRSDEKFDSGNYDFLNKNAQQPVQDVLTKQKLMDEKLAGGLTVQKLTDDAQRHDPNSQASKFYQSMVQQNFPGFLAQHPELSNASAEDITKAQPMIDTMIRSEYIKLQRSAMNEQRQEKDDNRRLDAMNKLIVAEKERNTTAFGKSANVMRQSDAINALIDQQGAKSITSPQFYELAKSLDSMLSQGSGSISGTKMLIPSTALSSFSNYMAWLSSSPYSAHMEDFVHQLQGTVNREKEVAQQQIMNTQKKFLGSFVDLKKRIPDRWDEIMTRNGLPTTMDETNAPIKSVNAAAKEEAYDLPQSYPPGTILHTKNGDILVRPDGRGVKVGNVLGQ